MTAPALPAIAGGWARAEVAVPAPTGERRFALWTPADPDAVLESCGPGDDPYWATLWPVGETLAARLLAEPFAQGTTVLELGCGAGLAGLAAASAGSDATAVDVTAVDVTATDLEPRAVALAAANAAANGLRVAARTLDWRDPPHEPFDRVIGADLLYQPDLHAALLNTLAATVAAGGEALLADPGRSVAAAFLHAAGDAGWRVRLEDESGHELWRPRVAGPQIVRLSRGA